MNDYAIRVATRGGKMTQEPLYPDGHPKRIEQDSQRINTGAPSPSKKKKKKKNDSTLHTSSEPEIEEPFEDNNDVSFSDAETQSSNEHPPSDNEMIMMMFMKMPNQTMIKNQMMMLKQNLLLILITHNLKIKDMIKETSLLENMEEKVNHGFRNPCPFHLNQPKGKVMKNLNALLKC